MSENRFENFSVKIANEYTSIALKLVHRENGVRLSVHCERTGDRVELDPVHLDAISSMDYRGLEKLVSAATEFHSANAAVGAPYLKAD